MGFKHMLREATQLWCYIKYSININVKKWKYEAKICKSFIKMRILTAKAQRICAELIGKDN